MFVCVSDCHNKHIPPKVISTLNSMNFLTIVVVHQVKLTPEMLLACLVAPPLIQIPANEP